MCVFLYNPTLFYSVSLIYFFRAATAFDILVLTMQKNYLHVVSNTHLCQYPFSILSPEFSDFWQLRPEKKSSSRLSGGYAINYDRKIKKIQAGNFHYNRKFITTGKKNMFQSSVWWVRDQLQPEKKKIQAGNFHYDRKKKSSSRLSGGCVSFWFWREIGSFFVVAGNFHYDRKKKSSSSLPEKKDTVVCLAGCAM